MPCCGWTIFQTAAHRETHLNQHTLPHNFALRECRTNQNPTNRGGVPRGIDRLIVGWEQIERALWLASGTLCGNEGAQGEGSQVDYLSPRT